MCDFIDGIDSLEHKGDLIFMPRLASFYRSVPAALIIYWVFERVNMCGHTKISDNYSRKWDYLTMDNFRDKFWWLTINDIMYNIEKFISSDQLIYDKTELECCPSNAILEGDFAIGDSAYWARWAM